MTIRHLIMIRNFRNFVSLHAKHVRAESFLRTNSCIYWIHIRRDSIYDSLEFKISKRAHVMQSWASFGAFADGAVHTRYLTDTFPQMIYEVTHSLPLRVNYRCLSWVRSLTEDLPSNLLCCVKYRVTLFGNIGIIYSTSQQTNNMISMGHRIIHFYPNLFALTGLRGRGFQWSTLGNSGRHQTYSGPSYTCQESRDRQWERTC